MTEQNRLTKRTRSYQLRARADRMAETRRRITRAAVELHGSVGPAATTMSAVAERAGVTRATLYRHFANEASLFGACSRAWFDENPVPDFASWARVPGPERRLRTALRELYAYYDATSGMLANLIRDIAALPEPVAGNFATIPSQMLKALDAGWPPTSNARLRRAAIVHALAFETWRSFHAEGLSDDEAAGLMAELVLGVNRRSAAYGW